MVNNEIPLFSGNTYHIYNHANGFENIFENEGNYFYFLKKYAEFISPIADTFAYALMPNHFHFLVQIKPSDILWQNFRLIKAPKKGRVLIKKHQILNSSYSGTIQQDEYLSLLLSKQFGNFFSAYTQAFNLQQNRTGSLFVSNFKRKVILDESYYSKVIHYIHHNPVHHHFTDHPSKWPNSSYLSLLSGQPTLLLRDQVLAYYGGKEGFITAHNREADLEIDW